MNQRVTTNVDTTNQQSLEMYTLPPLTARIEVYINPESVRLSQYIEAVTAWFKERNMLPALKDALRGGELLITELPAEHLRQWFDSDRIVFKESKIRTSRLRNITLPFETDRELDQPAILVFNGSRWLVQNGNHRTYAVISNDSNSSDAPLYALLFLTPQSYKQCLGSPPSEKGTTSPNYVED